MSAMTPDGVLVIGLVLGVLVGLVVSIMVRLNAARAGENKS